MNIDSFTTGLWMEGNAGTRRRGRWVPRMTAFESANTVHQLIAKSGLHARMAPSEARRAIDNGVAMARRGSIDWGGQL